MHDSVKNICERLNGEFSDEESVAVLVWTKRDVMDCAGCMEITEEEAGRVLSAIGDEGYHCEYGTGKDSVRDMLNTLREEEEQVHEVSVSAIALAQVLRVALDFMRLEDAPAGEGYAASQWRSEQMLSEKSGRR
ncbi:DUF1380 family protein [Pantoea sp. ME81]|uniref:DUF1380 family protein n=1 Tax=Pantoea sp. ME81 TaxID=2743935 RepID=UPI0015F6C69C|nr:DUF1380 family protein [Pantoea sp. ME81]